MILRADRWINIQTGSETLYTYYTVKHLHTSRGRSGNVLEVAQEEKKVQQKRSMILYYIIIILKQLLRDRLLSDFIHYITFLLEQMFTYTKVR